MSSATVDLGDNEPAVETVRVEHGGDDRSPSLAVVKAIADLAGVEPADLATEANVVLYDHVDPDALDALVAGRSDATVDVSLTVAGYHVDIDATDVVVRRIEE
ncbi:HalOD1 output domain-containing protein [Halorubrum aidingense]|uniref:HalOD1 output domain-containing protein n=1 Tax=Halorubrum aidingense TaxID=368623 RepID=UPI000677712F|nr:HalOD1 output domain-containing protein [Halorubrum aidingense]